MSLGDDMIPDSILEAASAWAFRLQDAPEDARLRAALAAWLSESEVHVHAWSLTQRAWELAGQAPTVFVRAQSEETAAASRPAALPLHLGRTPNRIGRRTAIGAIAAGLLLVLALPSLQLRLAADHRTAVGEVRRIPLDDGSVVTLSAESAIAVAFGAGARRVALLQGGAYFEVSPDSSRPFSVQAGDVTTTVTGTAFDVGLTSRTVSVSVAAGSVHVAGSARGASAAVDLGPAQGVVVDRTTGTMTEAAVRPVAIASWRKGRLVVEDALLADVVATIARFHEGSIVVASAALRHKRVTGVYDLGHPVEALRVLAAPYGGSVHEITPYLLVLTAD